VLDLASIGRWLVIGGLALAVIGGLVILAARTGIPLGRLPGDIHIQSGNVTVFIPLVTMILLSVILTILVNVVLRILGK
jgi:hypothetical protein